MILSWFRPEVLLWLLAVPAVIVLPPLLFRRRLRVTGGRAILRSIILVLLIVALAGPVVLSTGAQSTTIFLVDRSGSIQSGSVASADDWIASAVDHAGPEDDVMVSEFAGGVDRLAGPASGGDVEAALTGNGEGIDPTSTNIQSALQHAAAVPVGGARVVLLSDGAETTGMAQDEVAMLADAGIPVNVVSLSGVPEGELRMSGLSGPSVTWAGANDQIAAYVESDGSGSATLELSVDGKSVDEQDVQLDGEGGAVAFDIPAMEPGFHVLDVSLTSDTLPNPVTDNDSWPLGIIVREAPAVAVVTPVGGDSGLLESALENQGYRVEAVASTDFPDAQGELEAWDVVVLNNVPAWDLDTESQESLVEYARTGGGVMVLGGTASFGPGAYAATTLESMLPVTVKVTDGRDRPRVAVLLVIDRSGSMSYGESTSGAPKLELAQDGVVTAASALVPGDQVGVIAFNDEPSWALPMTTLTEGDPEGLISSSIADLSSDGGTELFPALQVAFDGIRNVDADVRHIIVLSDGRSRGAERGSYFRLLDDVAAEGISVSTIGLGVDADIDLLQDIAAEGNGRFHFVEDATTIPQITFEEAKAAGSQSVLRGRFSPVQLAPSPIMADVETGSMPALDGYNFAGARPGAQVVLASDRRDPLLVKWQFGLGRVVAWTGDSGADFAAEWSSWDGYDRFWGNALSWVLPDPANQQFEVAVTREGDRIRFDVSDSGGSSPTLASNAMVTVRDADETVIAGPLPASELSRSLPASIETGPAWLVEVDDGASMEVHAVTLGPGAEWQPSGSGDALLANIAEQTDGRVLDIDGDPADVFDSGRSSTGRQETVSVWWVPAGLALALFVADIAARLGVFPGRRTL